MGHQRPIVKTFMSHHAFPLSERLAKVVYARLMVKVMSRPKRVRTPAKGLTSPVGENLSFIIGEGKAFENPRQLAAKIAGEDKTAIENLAKLINRVMYRQENVEFKTLVTLADGLNSLGYDVQPWQLLVPDCNPANPRILMPVDSKQIKLWKALEEISDK